MMMPASSQMFYEFINDLGDIRGITLIALYADLRLYLNMIGDQESPEEIAKQAQVIYQDYIIENNTYEMESNDIIMDLRYGYDLQTGQINYTLDGELFQPLFDFCIGALEVFYAVFKKSDRYEHLKDEVER